MPFHHVMSQKDILTFEDVKDIQKMVFVPLFNAKVYLKKTTRHWPLFNQNNYSTTKKSALPFPPVFYVKMVNAMRKNNMSLGHFCC